MQTFLNDLWHNLQSYYTSFIALLPKFGMALIVFSVLLFLANSTRRFSRRRLSTKMDDPLLARFIARLIGSMIIVFAILVTLKILGLGGMAVGLLSTAGVGAFVIGFAFKDIGENFLAGVVLAFKRPFRVGDVVELDGHTGVVVTLNLRDTQIKTFDGKDINIPNALVVKTSVVNYTIDGFLRLDFTVGLDYDSDFSRAMTVILEATNKVPDVLSLDGKEPSIAISQLAASTLNLNIYFWIDTFAKNVSAVNVKNEVIIKVLQALTLEGFYLPGDILEVKTYRELGLVVKGLETDKTTS